MWWCITTLNSYIYAPPLKCFLYILTDILLQVILCNIIVLHVQSCIGFHSPDKAFKLSLCSSKDQVCHIAMVAQLDGDHPSVLQSAQSSKKPPFPLDSGFSHEQCQVTPLPGRHKAVYESDCRSTLMYMQVASVTLKVAIGPCNVYPKPTFNSF